MTLFEKWQGILGNDALVSKYQSYIEATEAEVGSFLSYNVGGVNKDATGPLANVPFAVKDNISVEDFNCTCGSRILENFASPYDATAVRLLKGAGAVPVAKTNLDEFGMGSSTDNSALQQSNNPWNTNAVCGGSSGGSAAAVASGLVPFALGSDTGGSVRQPASFCGCLGLKPTYGTVSRYGLVAYASSLEVIGLLTRHVDQMAEVYKVIALQDERDQSSVARPETEPSTETKKIGIFKNLEGLAPAIAKHYDQTAKRLQALGLELVEVDIPALKYVVPAYYTIATAEASANLARYTGIRYGHRSSEVASQEKMVAATRSEGFGDEVKLRIMLGTYVLRSGFQDQYYVRAQKIRTAIRKGFERVFDDVDLMLSPVFPSQAFLRGEAGLSSFQQKKADEFTAAANLAGLPALSFPTGVENGLPVGLQLIGPDFSEYRMFELIKRLPDLSGTMEPPVYGRGWRE